MAKNIVYFLERKPYINLTNACTNRCLFCIRDIKDDVVGANLWLDLDNVTIDDVVEQLNSNKDKIKGEKSYPIWEDNCGGYFDYRNQDNSKHEPQNAPELIQQKKEKALIPNLSRVKD